MTVYVDDAVTLWRGERWAHLMADTLDELHAFAARLGLPRRAFQNKTSGAHYDVTTALRAQAVALGATAISRHADRDLVRRVIARAKAQGRGEAPLTLALAAILRAMPRTVHVTRYVTPLREGGSMPAVVEADDDGLYVLKFRGAGQGRALVAEWIVGELARRLGFDVPELAFAELDPVLARTEADPEIQSLIRASEGRNLAMDYLPGAANFDPVAWTPDPALASRVVWFDAFASNVDRSTRNPNLMLWHRRLHLIDHGAALYFHHGWDGDTARAEAGFPMIRDHVLLPWADRIDDADAALSARLTEDAIRDVVSQVPDDWLQGRGAFGPPDAQRDAYADYLARRLRHRDAFLAEIHHARG